MSRIGGATLALGLMAAAFAVATAEEADGATREPVHVVKVRGDAQNGYWLRYSDGTGVGTPTISEARAECYELPVSKREARRQGLQTRDYCFGLVRAEYHGFRELKLALKYAH